MYRIDDNANVFVGRGGLIEFGVAGEDGYSGDRSGWNAEPAKK